MKNSLWLIAVLGSMSLGFTRGCEEDPHQVTSCPILTCDVDCGAAGHQRDANNCETCTCNPPQCTDPGRCDGTGCSLQTQADGCQICHCPPPPTGCLQDSDCAAAEHCDVTNYCDPPPGCEDGGTCPAVCYGRCVDVPNPCEGAAWGPTGVCQGPADEPLPAECCQGPNPCEGATLDSAGNCVSPNGQAVAAQCCPNMPPVCGDGTPMLCERPSLPNCVGPLVAAPYQNCTACFDALTCERQCFTDSDCDVGQRCKPDSNDACNGPTVRCSRPGVMTCQTGTTCGPVCDLYCPYGNVIDANGCETCSCNPPPSCVCTQEYAPVCGSDGNTYSNACEAACANVDVAHEGACDTSCTIECFVADPVCGADGVTYNCGAADATCHHTTVAYDGPCTPTCEVDCIMYQPVCGADGVTYGCGAADAACHHTTVAYDGPCGETCTVECAVYQPVCGADGVTYGCGQPDATCHHTTVVHDGPCDTPCATDSDCPQGTACYFPAPTPTARPAPQGKCEPPNYCESVADCASHPAPACAGGSWSCIENACSFSCGP